MQRQSIRQGIPLRPDFAAAASATPLIRAAVASLLAHVEHGQTIEVAKRLWPRDQNTAVITKAATAPASMTGSGWADTFVETVVPDFVLNLGPASAASAVLKRGALQLTFDGTGAFQIPNLTVAAANAAFVKEANVDSGQSIWSRQRVVKPAQACDRLCFQPGNCRALHTAIEKIVGLALVELSAESFGQGNARDASAGSATRPQGMRFGIAASPTSTKTVRSEAMAEDLATLIGAVGPIAGNYPVFVAAPAQAASLRLWYKPNINYEIFATSQLANGVVLAIASNCVVSAIDPQPRIETATEGLITLLDDAVPPQLAHREARTSSQRRQRRFSNLTVLPSA